MEKEIVKIGSVELYRDEAEKLYSENKYILTSTAVYKIMYSTAQCMFYGQKVYWEKGARFCKRGRYFIFDGAHVNRAIGHEIFI